MPYTRELNPMKHMWPHFKNHEMINLISMEARELSLRATVAMRKRRRSTAIAACSSQPEHGLFMYPYDTMLYDKHERMNSSTEAILIVNFPAGDSRSNLPDHFKRVPLSRNGEATTSSKDFRLT